jgi:hypothetical protein
VVQREGRNRYRERLRKLPTDLHQRDYPSASQLIVLEFLNSLELTDRFSVARAMHGFFRVDRSHQRLRSPPWRGRGAPRGPESPHSQESCFLKHANSVQGDLVASDAFGRGPGQILPERCDVDAVVNRLLNCIRRLPRRWSNSSFWFGGHTSIVIATVGDIKHGPSRPAGGVRLHFVGSAPSLGWQPQSPRLWGWPSPHAEPVRLRPSRRPTAFPELPTRWFAFRGPSTGRRSRRCSTAAKMPKKEP